MTACHVLVSTTKLGIPVLQWGDLSGLQMKQSLVELRRRSILVADDQLISAGVDTKIVFKSITEDKLYTTIRKYNSMPQVGDASA